VDTSKNKLLESSVKDAFTFAGSKIKISKRVKISDGFTYIFQWRDTVMDLRIDMMRKKQVNE